MKAYVINLPRSHDRRRHIEEQLARLELEYEIVAATDGSALTPEERERLLDMDAVTRAPDWLRPGIVGACLSHLAAYRAIAADGAPHALVVEDDAILPPDLVALLAEIAPELRGREAVLLDVKSLRATELSGLDGIDLPGGRRLLYPMDVAPLTAATAYVITREACLSMSEFVIPVRAGPDSWGFFVEHGGLDRVRCVHPRPCRPRTDFKSTVDYLGASAAPLQRIMSFVSEHRIFPLFQLAAWRRARSDRRMTRLTVVSRRSPFSDG
ncbi:MAG TPA: glycosyltransferase family 25 protein [Solirubrobacteraceae bacterium]|nr:glycosyltransferase family 25 protein [Solirubrobacteraceae bacterium]